MKDAFENDIVCKACKKKTTRRLITRSGFRIRAWQCKGCQKTWHHPLDANEYLKFEKLKRKRFTVKLRKVGNSFSATIPQEIIDYEGIGKEGRLIAMKLERPDRLSIVLR